MEDYLRSCAESLSEAERKLQSLLAISHEGIDREHVSEALSLVNKAFVAVSHAREDIHTVPDSAKRK